MAYDTDLAGRIETHLAARPEITAKKMIGGIAYFLNGNLACGVPKNSLIVRVGPMPTKARWKKTWWKNLISPASPCAAG